MSLSPLEQTLLQLLEIESPTGGEGPITDWIEAQLTGWGWQVDRLGHALSARRPQGSGGVPVGLFGHTDVVTDLEMAPIKVEVDEIHGPGASDMKGGLAVMLQLAKTLQNTSLAKEPTLVFYDKEEGPLADNGLGPLLAAQPQLHELALGLCLEPTDGQLHLGCVGSLHVEVTVHGKAGHSARPWQGVNAITTAGELLHRFHQWQPRATEIQGLTFHDTVTVTTIRGGQSRNSVPAACTFNVNLRFVPGRTTAEALADLTDFVGEDASLKVIDASGGADVVLDHPLVQDLLKTERLEVAAKQAWTDVAQLQTVGVPGINYGPGATGWAHQAGERLERTRLQEAYDVLERWLRG
ncbi:MAG: succinyl-diaminopimelate desuccinylase [Myxococcales bacterium]|nr:succinyl-diaminopimelate desuccinylase [Myxococcales bacterium]